MTSDQTSALVFKGQQFGLRLTQLYSLDMLKAYFAHYRGLDEVESAAGDPLMALYYQAIADALWDHITSTGDQDDIAMIDAGG